MIKRIISGNRKLLRVALASVFALSFCAAAFGAWPSFQNLNVNNGVITTGTPPITSPDMTHAQLPSASAWLGIDATSVLNNGIAYTLYDGGVNGARMQATNLSNGGTVWNVELLDSGAASPADVRANNISQLSTPYIDTTNGWIYAAKSYNENILPPSTASNWTLDGEAITGIPITSPTGAHTLKYIGTFALPAAYRSGLQIDSGINTASENLSATAEVNVGGTAYNLGTSKSFGGEFIIYNNANVLVPSGSAGLTINIDNQTGGALTVSKDITFSITEWALYSVKTSDGSLSRLANGYGQPNTPIGYSSPNYIYWGIYEGDRCYYQGRVSPQGALANKVSYAPSGGDDFYWAGAAPVMVASGTEYIVFGGDSGKIYVRPPASFASGTGNVITLTPTPGPIRSSVVSPAVGTDADSYIYFTSKGTGTGGYLWRIQKAALMSASPTAAYAQIQNSQTSTSTPVISANNILYVGTSGQYNSSTFDTDGTVQAYDPTATPFDEQDSKYIYGSNTTPSTGDAVQASPIVYSAGTGRNAYDYIYFATNTSSGAGYCYSYRIYNSAVAPVWTVTGTSANRYALQGFASDNGYLVYGDDGNYLYIIQ
jgi:hypothetical protein